MTSEHGQRKPGCRPDRHATVLFRSIDLAPGVIDLAVGKQTTTYRVWPEASESGRAFRLEKLADGETVEVYHVGIDGDRTTCDCRGFLHHRRCKHVEGLKALVAAGQL